MQILEIRTMALAASKGIDIVLRGLLDLDDVGAPVGQLAHRGRPGAHARQIEHANGGEWSHASAII